MMYFLDMQCVYGERGERDWDVVDLRVLRPTTASNEGMQGTPCHRAQELCESGGGRP